MDEGVSKTASLIDRFKLPLGLSLIGIILIIGGLTIGSKPQPKVFPKESLVSSEKQVTVDVSGAVYKPGVYKLEDGSRIEDAISQAGGFTPDAQNGYVTKVLNLAQKLVDGSKIYIPKEGESAPPNGGVAGTVSEAKININTASLSELDSLPGVGSVTAQKIVASRPYQTIEELVSKKAVSKSVFDKIKDQLVVY